MLKERGEEQTEVETEAIVKETLLEKSEMSLLIKDYNDIFSSFDPRPFSEKSLSDDFLLEAKRATRDKKGIYELRFLVPKLHRNFEHEVMIKKRLKEHFRKHHHLLEEEIHLVKRRGWFLIILGFFMMFLSIVIYSDLVHINTLLKSILIVITEPSGWFLFWIGGEKIVYKAEEKRFDLDFYNKMAEAEVKFSSY
ncbi:MAG: hypothetical protein AABX07_01840 [Nanoarchaeota archaeon]